LIGFLWALLTPETSTVSSLYQRRYCWRFWC